MCDNPAYYCSSRNRLLSGGQIFWERREGGSFLGNTRGKKDMDENRQHVKFKIPPYIRGGGGGGEGGEMCSIFSTWLQEGEKEGE